MRLLLVEDDAATVESIQLCLQIYRPDCTLVVIDNGLAVVSALKAEPFDVLILDLGLPGLDGMLILEELSQDSKVPVIVVTARHIENDRLRALELGVKDYITKPFDYKQLLTSLHQYCRPR